MYKDVLQEQRNKTDTNVSEIHVASTFTRFWLRVVL